MEEDIGSITKQLLNKNKIQVYDNQIKNIRNNKVPDDLRDDTKELSDDTMNTNFGDISDIQIPYIIPEQQINYSVNQVNYSIEEEDSDENFCSYVLYFIIIIIILGYIGYNLGSEKVLPNESINGITMGLLIGMIIVNLLWSSIKNN
jgi:hypothetical protein